MYVKYHVLLGLIFSFIFWIIFPSTYWFYILVIFLSSVLIDFDHYLYYALKKKDLNLNHSYNWFIEKDKQFRKMPIEKREKYKRVNFVFHGIEFIIILALLIYVHVIFVYILVGILFHLILDFIDLERRKEKKYIKISQIYILTRNK